MIVCKCFSHTRTHTTHTFSHLHVCERAKFRTFAHPQRISAYEQGMGCKGACAVARVCERAKFILKNVQCACVRFVFVRAMYYPTFAHFVEKTARKNYFLS